MPRHNKFCFELFKIEHVDFFVSKLVVFTLLAIISKGKKIIKGRAK